MFINMFVQVDDYIINFFNVNGYEFSVMYDLKGNILSIVAPNLE